MRLTISSIFKGRDAKRRSVMAAIRQERLWTTSTDLSRVGRPNGCTCHPCYHDLGALDPGCEPCSLPAAVRGLADTVGEAADDGAAHGGEVAAQLGGLFDAEAGGGS